MIYICGFLSEEAKNTRVEKISHRFAYIVGVNSWILNGEGC